MNKITVPAYAKINLTLDVLRRRPNGYHDVCMVMQSLELHDSIYLEKAETPGIVVTACENSLQARLYPDIRWDESNLVYKAAKLFLEHFCITEGVRIIVDKQIPSAAGLAGGSSDAAATLKGLNELFCVGATMQQLQSLGVLLGADVPYCIQLGTALSEGIGEVLTSLPNAPSVYCVLVKPEQAVSTKYVYEHLNLNEQSMHPDTEAMLSAIKNQDALAVCHQLSNILEPVALPLCPIIPEIEHTLLQYGAQGACMSGSGPTVFGLFTEEQKAKQATEFFQANGYPHTAFFTEFHQN